MKRARFTARSAESVRQRLQRLGLGTLRRQLIGGIVLVQLVLMSFFVFDLTTRQAEFIRSQQFERSAELAKMLAVSSRSWVLASDLAGLREVVATVSSDPGLRYVMVLDRQGRVLAHSEVALLDRYVVDPLSQELLSGPPALRRLVTERRLIDVAAPVVAGEEALGWARVGLDLSEHQASLQKTGRNGLIYTLLAFLAGSLFAVLMARRLTRDLQGLVEASHRLAQGEQVQLPRSERHDEVGLLARSFSDMARTLAVRERSLQESEFRFRTLFAQSPDPVWLDDGSRLLECNPAAVTALGHAQRGELLARPLAGLSTPGQPAAEADDEGGGASLPSPAGDAVRRFEWTFLRADGQPFHAEVTRAGINLQGQLAYYTTLRDISARRHDEAELRLAASVFENILDCVLIAEADGTVVSVNPAFTRVTGYAARDAIGQTPRLLRSGRHDRAFYDEMWRSLCDRGSWQGEIWNRRRNGELFLARETITRVAGGDAQSCRYIAVFGDITEIHLRDERIQHLAFHDALTGLPNRVLLQDRLEQGMAMANREGHFLAVLFLDLDRFKEVNDRFGHRSGDELLQEVARRLRGVLREVDTLSRLGGDEFVIVLQHPPSEQEVQAVAERIIAAIDEPVQLGENSVCIGVSIGIALYPGSGHDVTSLLKNADAAMYAAKNAGRNTYRRFLPGRGGDAVIADSVRRVPSSPAAQPP